MLRGGTVCDSTRGSLVLTFVERGLVCAMWRNPPGSYPAVGDQDRGSLMDSGSVSGGASDCLRLRKFKCTGYKGTTSTCERWETTAVVISIVLQRIGPQLVVYLFIVLEFGSPAQRHLIPSQDSQELARSSTFQPVVSSSSRASRWGGPGGIRQSRAPQMGTIDGQGTWRPRHRVEPASWRPQGPCQGWERFFQLAF